MREIRSSGSVRGVQSDPYPYRDGAPTRCASIVLFKGSTNQIGGRDVDRIKPA
jgi:hypothetical protein